jgi:hypothetical protein
MAAYDMAFPHIDPALVERLDQIFSERTPDLATPIEQIRFDVGARSVVRLLMRKLAEKEEDALSSPILPAT